MGKKGEGHALLFGRCCTDAHGRYAQEEHA